ncbi:MAG: hypothetical protein KJT03_23770, partial [Verrucomicrobiae bacterium]|nr:hypothetical protein [Verrucomicrobiae bacterium]
TSLTTTLEIQPKRILIFLLGCFVFLLLMNFASVWMKFTWGLDRFQGAARLFHFDEENNVPSFFSALCLFVSSLLLLQISLLRKKQSAAYLAWLGLSLIFCFLSVDEVAMFHERLVGPLDQILDTSGYLRFAWVIPYGLATLILAVVYLRFLVRLPGKTRTLFIVAGILFISGALGMEMISANYFDHHGGKTLAYDLMTTLEESLEMLGVFTFIYALLAYLGNEFPSAGVIIRKA